MATSPRYDPRADAPVPPGETIREILDERAISQVDFAVRLGKSEKFVSQMINGKATVSCATAIDLERVLGVPAAFWNNAEAAYRDALARVRDDAEYREQAEWAASFPVKAMEAQCWIARDANTADELLGFFGVSSIDAYRTYWSSDKRLAARMSTAYSPETPAIAAWLRAGERAAESVRTAPYDEQAFRRALAELRAATRLSPAAWQPQVREQCAAAGVAVVLVPDLPKTRMHAASWWVSRSRAVIELGLRYKTDDQIWFSLFHEAGHLLLDDRSRSSISDLADDPASERRADGFAADTLIPPADYAALRAAGRPTRADVIAFAERIGVAPSIVVGRLQKDGAIPRDWMNDLKIKLDWAAA